ncbi:MAG TPA: hypothetical protein VIV57_21210 [Anaeromyxobacter sp.]
MMNDYPREPRLTPGETAESEEKEIFERSAAERGPSGAARQGDRDDPREEEGWTQPESSAQKGAVRDEG